MRTHTKKPVGYARAQAAKIILRVVDQGKSLDDKILGEVTEDRAFIQELSYGVCRWLGELESVASQFLRKPLRKKDRDVHYLLLVGLYQLRYIDTASHAAIYETVEACKALGKPWAAKMINGCLRNYQRTSPPLDPIAAARLAHPAWLQEALTEAWPEHVEELYLANNERPPMCLRVNQRQHKRDQYLQILRNNGIACEPDQDSTAGIRLDQPCAVNQLPGFAEGACSVQDTAAQLAVQHFDVGPEHVVLDACSAPGGKLAHLAERLDGAAKLDALDISTRRCQQTKQTLERLSLQANLIEADARHWRGEYHYDRIMVDAPCSGLGVLRRHPDIRHHRSQANLRELITTQAQILDNCWHLLKPNGQLLYVTCSLLPAENEAQINASMQRHEDATVSDLMLPTGLKLEHGWQTLPNLHDMDGFYYCLLIKAG